MKEKVFKGKRYGMAMLLLLLVLYGAATAGLIYGVAGEHVAVGILAGIWVCIGWIPFLGLKVLRPQEALVLTLFGKYIGTLKDNGFYYVNPFCTSVNPASKTRLSQSGDVDGGKRKESGQSAGAEAGNKKIDPEFKNNDGEVPGI